VTALARLFARWLPRPLLPFVLALVYAGMMLAIVVVGTSGGTKIVYVDIEKRQ
jgi:hypothetical protein